MGTRKRKGKSKAPHVVGVGDETADEVSGHHGTDQEQGMITDIAESYEPFRLLDLPPELWSRICKLAVVRKEPIHVTDSDLGLPWTRKDLSNLWRPPPITRVCRQIRHECLPHFYADNVIFVDHWHMALKDATLQWLRRIGDENRGLLKNLYLYNADDWEWMDELQSIGLCCRDLTASEMAAVEQMYWRRDVSKDVVKVVQVEA